jgi:biopolymer transport protein ExbD
MNSQFDETDRSDQCAASTVGRWIVIGVLFAGLGTLLFNGSVPNRMMRSLTSVLTASERPVRLQSAPELRVAQAPASLPAPPRPTKGTMRGKTLQITLDETGAIRVDGQPAMPADLRDVLCGVTQATGERVTATVSVDGRCPFQHVVRVQRICEEVGAEITHVDAVAAVSVGDANVS